MHSNVFSLLSNKLEAFKADANNAIHFKLVRDESDLENHEKAPIFKPEMTHQIFGESESIFGYKDLSINIYCTAAKMKMFIGARYSEKINSAKFDGVEPDDFVKMLKDHLQPSVTTNLDSFVTEVRSDVEFKPFGTLVHSYERSVKGSPENRYFEIYQVKEATSEFISYHERLQPFLLFFVDAASYISVDDARWNYYLIHEKYTTSDGRKAYAFVGYMTVYNFFAYPDKIRPRVSQVLIMPPFQRQGHGTVLLQTFYKQCWAENSVLDISVEDASDDFTRLRDFVDCVNCRKLPSFSPKLLRQGFTEKMAQEARGQFKISKRQARKVYEILRLSVTNLHDEAEFKGYRVDVKKRLNIPFQKNSRHFDRLCKTLKPQELAAALNTIPDDKRVEVLEQNFQVLLSDYQLVLKRLENDVDVLES